MTRPASSSRAAATAGLLIGALVLVTFIPLRAEQTLFPAPPLGLLLFAAGLGGLMLTFAGAAAARGDRRAVVERLEAASLWGACGLAVLCAFAAVAASAESLSLVNIVLAQRNTGLYALRQPAAAAVYVVAVALAGQDPALRAVLGPASPSRAGARVAALAAVSAAGATLFLAGFAGDGLPGPVWLVLKTALVGGLLFVTRRWLGGLAHGPRLAIAWMAAMVGVLNLAISLILATR